MSRRQLILDTETTGFLNTKPHIVQLGLLLICDGREAASFHTLIDPEGQWEVPPDSTKVHGITTEMCMDTGIPIRDALILFEQLAYMAGNLVAHNWEFDSAVLDLELDRIGIRTNYYTDGRQICTMKEATDVCKLPFANPGKGGRRYKYPSLAEAYRHFTGREMENAHTAWGDVRACYTVYQHLMAVAEAAGV